MNIGSFRHRIKFITEGLAPDYFGGYVPTPDEVLETFAGIEQISRRSMIANGLQDFINVYRVTIHNRKDFHIDSNLMVIWDGRRFRILAGTFIDDFSFKKQLTFDMVEVI